VFSEHHLCTSLMVLSMQLVQLVNAFLLKAKLHSGYQR
jgi:hypothetical protein